MKPTDLHGPERGRPALQDIERPDPDRSGSAGREAVATATAAERTEVDCGYRNSSDRMVIVRCCGPSEFFLERVVFPFELLSFRCPGRSEIKIWTHGLGGPELLETFHAEDLRIDPVAALGIESREIAESPWLRAS